MKKIIYLLTTAAVISGSLCGCSGTSDDEYTPPAANKISGKPDPSLAGEWKSTQGKSDYNLRADGTFDFDGVAVTRQGKFNSHYTAKWSVDGDKIFFEDESKNVSCYIYKAMGDKMELRGKGGNPKVIATLVRKQK